MSSQSSARERIIDPSVHRWVPILLLLPLCACASVITGSEDDVEIKSDPPGARFTTNTGHTGTTPSTIRISDEIDLEVTCSMAGRRTSTEVLKSHGSAWVAGNLILGGLIGFIIDFATGNWQTHDSEILITLPAAEPGVPGAEIRPGRTSSP